MTVAISRSLPVGPVRSTPSGTSVALDLNSCRQEIERAAAAKVAETALTIRQCLLQAGLSTTQASNRTMQARVRREVQRLTQGKTRKTFSTGRDSVPREIHVPMACSSRTPGDDFDSYTTFADESFEDDNISVLTDPTYLQNTSNRVPLHLASAAAPRTNETAVPVSLSSMYLPTVASSLPAAAFPLLEAQQSSMALFPVGSNNLFVASGLVDAANDWMLKAPFDKPQFRPDQGQDLSLLPFAMTNAACISR